MRSKNRLGGGGAAIVVVLAAACSRGVTAGAPSPTPNPAGSTAAVAPAAARTDTTPAQPAAAASPAAPSGAGTTETAAQFEALYRAREDSARLKVSPADVRFMAGMIHHHAQAIVMSRLAPSHGASASVQTLAARIINAQQDEIRTMQTWLRDRGQAVPQLDAAGNVVMGGDSAMAGMPMGHDTASARLHHDMGGMAMGQGKATGQGMALMPGMLTPEQMEQLRRARGAEFDRLFLTDMIQHHGGAITMVNDLFSTDGAARDQLVFKLASDVQVDQTTEIARMRRMLTVMELSGR